MAYPLSASVDEGFGVAAGSAVFSPRYYVQRKGMREEEKMFHFLFSQIQ
jgi:hypothetical protein